LTFNNHNAPSAFRAAVASSLEDMTAPSLEQSSLDNAEVVVRATKEDTSPRPPPAENEFQDDGGGNDGAVTADAVRRSLRRWNSSDLSDASASAAAAAARRSRKIVGGSRIDSVVAIATTTSAIQDDAVAAAPTAARCHTLLRSKSADWNENEPLGQRPESPRRRIRPPENATAARTKFGQSVRRTNSHDTIHNHEDNVDHSHGDNGQNLARSCSLIEV
jgi:hypothetical protein